MLAERTEGRPWVKWADLVVGCLLGVMFLMGSIGAAFSGDYIFLVHYFVLAALSFLPCRYWRWGVVMKYAVLFFGFLFGGYLGTRGF